MTDHAQTRAAVYLRMSSDPTGQALGVARQREDCLRLCADRGWTPVEYTDNDVSASSGKSRPAYEAMLEDIREGRIGAVAVWHLDRLHRQPIELERFVELADAHRVALATVTGDVDLSTDDGRFMARIMGAVARKEVERKRARQLRAAQQKAEHGKPNWRNAFGYTSDYEPDPVTAPLVREAYASVLAGGSITEVAKHWNALGHHGLNGKPWRTSTVSLYLRSPRNAGLRAHRGEIIGKGTWPALVDEDLWRAAQAVLEAPERKPGKKSVRKHLLSTVLYCGLCNEHLTGSWQGDPARRKLAYACRGCRRVSVRAAEIEPLLLDVIAARLASPDAADLLKAEAHDTAEDEALRLERMALLGRLDEISDERADGAIDGRAYQRMVARITEKLDAIDARQHDRDRVRVLDGVRVGTAEAAEDVAALSPDRYRAVINLLARVVILGVGKGHRFSRDRVQVEWHR